MIKAVFFDWFNTLARYEPAREDLAAQVLGELGFDLSSDRIRFAISLADKWWFEENTRSPVRVRSREEQAKVYAGYQKTALTELGIDTTKDTALLGKVISRMQALSSSTRFVLFDDVLPALKDLKQLNLMIGVLTNLDQDMTPLSKQLGLEPYVDLFVTSGEIGVDKPNPPIFLAALERAKVKPSEAVHIGDQYGVDVVGARGVGITPLLIDRHGYYPQVSDCPRLKSLTEIVGYLGA
jgi:putative hydrolase of the HAD superfamily